MIPLPRDLELGVRTWYFAVGRKGRTLADTLVSEKQTSSLAETDWSESSGDYSSTGSEEFLRFMNIVDSLAASSDVLRVDWADSIPSRSNTED